MTIENIPPDTALFVALVACACFAAQWKYHGFASARPLRKLVIIARMAFDLVSEGIIAAYVFFLGGVIATLLFMAWCFYLATDASEPLRRFMLRLTEPRPRSPAGQGADPSTQNKGQ